MIIRFFEYDSQIALDDATIEKEGETEDGKKSGGVLTVTFPHSAVLFLRSNENTGDVMKMKFVTPGGELDYDIPIIKMQEVYIAGYMEQRNVFVNTVLHIHT